MKIILIKNFSREEKNMMKIGKRRMKIYFNNDFSATRSAGNDMREAVVRISRRVWVSTVGKFNQ